MAFKRGVALLLGLLGLAVLVSAAGMTMLYLMVGSGGSVPANATLVVRPGAELLELPSYDVLQLVQASDAHTIRGLVESLRKAKADARVRAVLLRPQAFESPFWAKVQELRDAIVDFRASGKPVVAFLEYGGNREYYLASAADKVFLLPTATLDLVGVANYELFLRGTLDWVGTYPDLLHIGDYKTAVNTFTEKTMTPAHREMAESLTRDQYQQLVRAVADGRRKSESDVRALFDQGPFLPDEALRQGLVDELAYEDELDDHVRELDGGNDVRQIDVNDYAQVGWPSLGLTPRSRVAVIYAAGTIVSGRSTYDPVNGPVLGADTIIEHIREARADQQVKAIVLRVDSPGGSSTASDMIWRELTISKDVEPRRPLIVSMSDLAASGGYYIAMAGDVIVAEPGTLTGSIGIYTGKFVTGGTYDKLGANIESTSVGAHAEMYSPDRRFTPIERKKVMESMQAFYDQFVEKAADARQTTPEKIDQIAQGRVWTGEQARQVGLVDQLGGLQVALAVAKQRANIPVDEEVELVIYPRRRTVYEALSERLDDPVGTHSRAAAEALGALLGTADRRAISALLAPARLFRSGEILAHMPYVFL
ncbi:MAG: signal peptide peptidase SppA, partial [Vicinamibacterales bacterium]